MTGRALAFADADIIRMGTEDYIAVAGDDWYQRRRNDAEGKFFIKVADQGPRRGGDTRQGIYCFTADGQLLAYKNAGQAPDVMREVLQEGLARWARLPESRRRPGAVQVGSPGKLDENYVRTPPAEGLVVNVFTRTLDVKSEAKGSLECEADSASARDHLWLTKEEWRSLAPPNLQEGERFALPARIAERIVRFHLVDNTRGEPPHWERNEVRKANLTATVLERQPKGARVRLRVEGEALAATDADVQKAERGYEARLLGFIEYDGRADRISRFDLVALGEHWGDGPFTEGARPGRSPLGVAFELAEADSASRVIPPQGARELQEYFGRGD